MPTMLNKLRSPLLGVPVVRVVLGKPRKTTEANDKAVTLRLELEVAR